MLHYILHINTKGKFCTNDPANVPQTQAASTSALEEVVAAAEGGAVGEA